MVGSEEIEYEKIRHGLRDPHYDKCLMFRRDKIVEINYAPGAHSCNPLFVHGHQAGEYLRRNMYHFRWLSLSFVIERYKRNAKRISRSDRKKGYAHQYFLNSDNLAEEYYDAQKNSSILPIAWNVVGLH